MPSKVHLNPVTEQDAFTGFVGAYKQIAAFGLAGVVAFGFLGCVFWLVPHIQYQFHLELKEERMARKAEADMQAKQLDDAVRDRRKDMDRFYDMQTKTLLVVQQTLLEVQRLKTNGLKKQE